MWQYYTSDAPDLYPAPSAYPGDTPPHDDNGSTVANTVIRETLQSNQKDYAECMQMNKSLTEHFLSIFANNHRRGYNSTIVSDPNRTFGNTFAHFYEQFGIRDKAEIEQNRDNMRRPWKVADGWEVLKDRFDNRIAYAVFADATISASDDINMLIAVIVKTRVFQTQYEESHALPPGNRTLDNVWIWWGMKARLKQKIGSVAGEMSCGQHYGGNAARKIIQHQPAGDSQYESLIE